ncbi:M23 family metallopeptidase [Candidatus Woesebacteria bacterium]|nr:MAG: M23 family metallopeptidase [Candidatus Woesebacteria bacterium]
MRKKRYLFVFSVLNISKKNLIILGRDLREFSVEFSQFLIKHVNLSFIKFESVKGIFVAVLYKKRGKHTRAFMHSGMASLAMVGIMIAPVIAEEFPGTSVDPWGIPTASTILSATSQDPATGTLVSDKVRDGIIDYSVQDGDTVSSVANKFGIDINTILWQNDLTSKSTIKPGQTLQILPVSGVSHKVIKGDTIYSIAKKYDADAQPIVNFPFNTFTNDETFELAIGQIIIVPEGIRKSSGVPAIPRIRQLTPDAGTVVASGRFVWPASGSITQNFAWYHKGLDIANRAAPNILAADAGVVVVAGWPDSYGYGNRVVVDHQNGYKTLYAHLSQIFVQVGQRVNTGDAVGRMGSTGRSTGTHLHFEVIQSGVQINPLNVLR